MPGGLVDPDVARLDVAGERHRGPQVAGEDARGEPVLDAVGDRQCLVVVGERDRGQHRAEDLLGCQPAVRVDVGEQGRADEVALGQVALGQPDAAGDQPGALALADLDVAEHLVQLLPGDDRAGVAGGVERRSRPQARDALPTRATKSS